MTVAHLRRGRRRPDTDARLAELVDELDHAAELECIRLDHLAGRTPPNMRRALFDHEVNAGVNFAELGDVVDRRASSIGDRLARDRARFGELLQADLEQAIAASPAIAADQVVAGRLADLLDPSRYADPVAGTTELVAEAERVHSAELAHAVQEGMARAVAEARAQGIPAGHLPGLPAAAQGRLDTLARRLASQPHADVVTAARHAADQVAGTGYDAATVLDHVNNAVTNLAPSGLDNYARPAAQQAHNLGHQEAAGAAPHPVTIYASELLDRNTCGPCSLIDGHEYASEEEALADYPGGTYIDCEGGDRCRGTLVYVWNTEAPPTEQAPGDEPPPPPDQAPPYPFGTARPIPPPPPLPVVPDVVAPPAPAPGVEFPTPAPTPEPAPPAPTSAQPGVPLELPDQPVEAPIGEEELAQARRDLAAARMEVRAAAKAAREEVLGQLDRADAVKLKRPAAPKQVRNLVTGRVEWRTESNGYEWYLDLDDAEKSRLRRFWMPANGDEGIAPDELASHWADRLGRDVTTEEAAGEWLDLNRRADALSTLSRGRIINTAPYGGLDVNTLVDSPYNLRLLFSGDPEEAAAHLAGVTRDLETRSADNMFARPTLERPLLGAQPYELTQEQFIAEVSELENAQAAIVPLRDDEFGVEYRPEDQRVIDRLRELVPPGVEDDNHPLGLDELHDVILRLARSAGRL